MGVQQVVQVQSQQTGEQFSGQKPYALQQVWHFMSQQKAMFLYSKQVLVACYYQVSSQSNQVYLAYATNSLNPTHKSPQHAAVSRLSSTLCYQSNLLYVISSIIINHMFKVLKFLISHQPPHLIRNFCIIAHIDHGKSTLADRLLEITRTIPVGYQHQFLDKLKVERDRGITVQSQTVSMRYTYNNEEYLMNLIDTPGHVDFHYQVQRSMRGCQGALLLIDATQGVQAQTLANFQLGKKEKLKIITVFNKIDANCDLQNIEKEARKELNIEGQISKVSAKTGLNVESLLARIINEVPPPPVGKPTDNLKLFLVNSWFVNNKNVVCLFYVMSGQIKKGMTIVSSHFNKPYTVFEVGLMQPEFSPMSSLVPGQIGYVISNMKQVKQARIGDTFHIIGKKVEAEPGFKPAKPMMFAGLYPVQSEEFNQLQKNLQKLVLTDPAVTYTQCSSATLGSGFRCGFLGMLHMDVFRQRLEDEFNIDTILTTPTVPYKCKIRRQNKIIEIDSAADAPDKDRSEYFLQPMANCMLVFPPEYSKDIKSLCENRRGSFIEQNISNNKVFLKYKLPLSEIITDFVDKLKSLTHGYGSFEYEHADFERSDIVKVVVHIMGDPVDALTFLFHQKKAFDYSKAICQKIKETISPHLFTVSIQARIGTKTIAKQEIPHIKKNVTAKCYGGDYSRKKKLLQRYKQGKKKLKAIGKVQVGKQTFLHVMKS